MARLGLADEAFALTEESGDGEPGIEIEQRPGGEA